MRLTVTLCERDPEVAVMVTWEVAGAGVTGAGEDGGAAAGAGELPPPLQPVIAPRLRMQTMARMARRRCLLLLRTPAKLKRVIGSRPASTLRLRGHHSAVYGEVGVIGAAVPAEKATPTLTGVVPETLTEAGVKLQDSPLGRPEQERETVPLKPFVAARLSDRLPTWLPVTLTVAADEPMVKSPACAGGATVIEPKRPPFSSLTPAAK
jgi:hypothetical protein